MTKELKPCPACNEPSPEISNTGRDSYVRCPHCCMRGPEAGGPTWATEAWNAMPRRLRWSKEPPKEPGWYWIRDYGKRIHIVDVGCDMTEYEPQPYREWAGPIPEPEE